MRRRYLKPIWAVRQQYRETGLLEDICEHGVGHPNSAWVLESGSNWRSVHGCDGCCSKNIHRSENLHQNEPRIMSYDEWHDLNLDLYEELQASYEKNRICFECDGAGYINCHACESSNVCKFCDGAGTIIDGPADAKMLARYDA